MYKEVGFALLILYHFQGIFFLKKCGGWGWCRMCGDSLCKVRPGRTGFLLLHATRL